MPTNNGVVLVQRRSPGESYCQPVTTAAEAAEEMFERFTDRARRVVVLAQEEARMLDHNYIGTEHILLGVIREGEGVAAQVLVKLGADLNTVRRQVIQLLNGYQSKEPAGADPELAPVDPPGKAQRRLLDEILSRVNAIEVRLAAVEQRVGTGSDTGDLDQRIAQVRSEKELAVDAQEFERAAALRDQEKELLAQKATRHQEWAVAHPGLPDLAEACHHLSREIERLHALLRQHGIEPEDRSA